ncbi:MAG: hypothetical protein FIA91_01720 [Geobacter sp.]|nr:hypothetical protein [Geobacter sp.]
MKQLLIIVALALLTATAVSAERSGGRVAIIPATASLDTTPPSIDITSPDVSRGVKIMATETKTLVRGRASDESGVVSVTVNGIMARLDDKGNFAAELFLKPGENAVSVVSVDTRGNQGMKRFAIFRQIDSLPPAQEVAQTGTLFGTNYALIIGIQNYSDSNINSLDQPLQDAQRLYETLTRYYTFTPDNVTLLRNPDRISIIQAFDQLAQKTTDNDSVLIFYAGHGFWDERLKQGFWLPSNALRKSRAEWLSNGTIRDYINGIKSRHTLLIADACFSGGIFKTRSAFSEATSDIKELQKLPSRKAMTSGAMKEVPDKSVFIEYLVKRLTQNKDQFLSSEQLFASFRQAVISNSRNNQVPQFGEIRETGDEGGDFVFERKP